MQYSLKTLDAMTQEVSTILREAGFSVGEAVPFGVKWSKDQPAMSADESKLVFWKDGSLYFDYSRLHVLPQILKKEQRVIYLMARENGPRGAEISIGPVTFGQLNQLLAAASKNPFVRASAMLGAGDSRRVYPEAEIRRLVAQHLAKFAFENMLSRWQDSWLRDDSNLSARIISQGIVNYGVGCVCPPTLMIVKDVWTQKENDEGSYPWLIDEASGPLVDEFLSDAKLFGIHWLINNHPFLQKTGEEISLLPDYVEFGRMEYERLVMNWKLSFNDPKLAESFKVE